MAKTYALNRVKKDGWEYVFDKVNNRWEVVNGPHSGHVTISESAPVNSGADREYPLEDGELWFKPSESCMRIWIAATGKWTPVVSAAEGVPGEPGEDGKDGRDGEDGAPGLSAPSPKISTANTWVVYELNSAGTAYVERDTGIQVTGMSQLLNMKGVVNTPEELPDDAKNADAYLVNKTNTIWFWAAQPPASGYWVEAGFIAGPQGIPGEPGRGRREGWSAWKRRRGWRQG